MTLKRLRLPSKVTYPIRIIAVHITAGQVVKQTDLLYTLVDANGKRGQMRAPVAGRVCEGPVPLDSSFSEPCLVLGLDSVADDQPPKPKAQPKESSEKTKDRQRPEGATQEPHPNDQISELKDILGDIKPQPDETAVEAIVRVHGSYQGANKVLTYAYSLASDQKNSVIAMVDSWAKKQGVFFVPTSLESEIAIEVVTPFLLPLLSFGLASTDALAELTSNVPGRAPTADELEKYFAKNISVEQLEYIIDVLGREQFRSSSKGNFYHLGPSQKFDFSELTAVIYDQFRLVKLNRAQREDEAPLKKGPPRTKLATASSEAQPKLNAKKLEQDFRTILSTSDGLIKEYELADYQEIIVKRLMETGRNHLEDAARAKVLDPRLEATWKSVRGEQSRARTAESHVQSPDLAHRHEQVKQPQLTRPPAKERIGGFLVSVLTPFVVGAVITLFLIQGSNINTLEFLAVSSIGASIVLIVLGTEKLPKPGALRLFVSTLAFLIMPAIVLILISMPKYSLEHSYADLIFNNGRGVAGFLSSTTRETIADELDLPSISKFSNGRVPQPTLAQQSAFERFILE